MAVAGTDVAVGFLDAPEGACVDIEEHSANGALRHAHELAVPGLRCRPVRRFPDLVFNIESEDAIDVWRTVAGTRIPVLFWEVIVMMNYGTKNPRIAERDHPGGIRIGIDHSLSI